jgi:hypothetical protein
MCFYTVIRFHIRGLDFRLFGAYRALAIYMLLFYNVIISSLIIMIKVFAGEEFEPSYLTLITSFAATTPTAV